MNQHASSPPASPTTNHKSFAEFTKQVHLINDLILADMIYVSDEYAEESSTFKRHLLATKFWFGRVSWANKRRYVLALLHGLRSAWALSALLKAIWSCRPKDAVYSVVEWRPLCSFDQVPVDHNRTAQPIKTLAQTMMSERKWFHTLDPECQAIVLAELVASGGGPLMWEVARRAQTMYERYREHQMEALLQCSQGLEQTRAQGLSQAKSLKSLTAIRKSKSRSTQLESSDVIDPKSPASEAQKQLDASLAEWNSIINAIKESQKLEEVEVTIDGSTRKIWKVNRPKPEAIETVDFIQLLPSWIGKQILSYLPAATLPDYGKVNKYWAYLVEDYKQELAARAKINMDLEKLKNLMQLNEPDSGSLEDLAAVYVGHPSTTETNLEPTTALFRRQTAPSVRPSERSGYSSKWVYDKLKTKKIKQKPIRNMAELSERLERRGAADDNLWLWCRNVVKHAGDTGSQQGKHSKKDEEGVMRFVNAHFPCPLMKESVPLPLDTPLLMDPAATTSSHRKSNVPSAMIQPTPREPPGRRLSLWSRDFSSLYKVVKVAAYQSPV